MASSHVAEQTEQKQWIDLWQWNNEEQFKEEELLQCKKKWMTCVILVFGHFFKVLSQKWTGHLKQVCFTLNAPKLLRKLQCNFSL